MPRLRPASIVLPPDHLLLTPTNEIYLTMQSFVTYHTHIVDNMIYMDSCLFLEFILNTKPESLLLYKLGLSYGNRIVWVRHSDWYLIHL
jgi:hypothetical protein